MKHFVGLDVSLKEVSICVIDADGVVAAEDKVATEPALIVSWIGERIVHESGPLSIWLTRELTGLGAPVACIDARADDRHSPRHRGSGAGRAQDLRNSARECHPGSKPGRIPRPASGRHVG